MACQRDVLQLVREDDFVEYFLFSLENFDDETASQTITSLLSQVNDIGRKGSENYIWQKDEFVVIPRNTSSLPPIVDNEESLPPHLYGVTHYGENIEDEWFIVHLLMQLTLSIPGLIVRVIDVDGEFLLIEAADHLPQWASPEICDKRVYIYKGEIHIIPPTKEEDQVSVSDALTVIRDSPQSTRASQEIQNAIKSRLSGYPEKVFELLHQTTAFVPIRVAALLRARPSLIAPAVSAFCHRDPIDLRAMRAMRHFPPETRVMTTVKMTRCQYAMLCQAKYTPDRKTGWHLPLASSPHHLAHTIGVKLACGFEILVTQSRSKESIDDDKGWLRYRQSLTEKGYFKEQLEGSVEYKRLEAEAKEYYRTHCCYSQKPLAQTVNDLLASLEVDEEGMKKAEANLPPPDDDSWMTISSDDLDRIMTERYGARPQTSDISAGLAAFLNNISGLEGVQHPSTTRSTPPEVPLRQKRTKKTEEPRDDENNRISFDQESFTCALNNILDFSVPEDSWDLESDESGMSSYEDEAEMDLSRKKNIKRASGSQGSVSEMKQYMDQMDRELQATAMGQSFIKKQPKVDSPMHESEENVEFDQDISDKVDSDSEEGDHKESVDSENSEKPEDSDEDVDLEEVEEVEEATDLDDPLDREDATDLEAGDLEEDSVDSEEVAESEEEADEAERSGSPTSEEDSSSSGMEDSFSDIESFEPVDIDVNAVQHMLASYEAQMGGAGPASNMLGPMGVSLERN